jgi:hypothetical protein
MASLAGHGQAARGILMTPDQENKAREIFTRHSREWTSDENAFLLDLFKNGHRANLKTIIKEFPLHG